MKQGIFHCFINYELKRKEGDTEITTESTFHFSGNASEERQIKAIGCVCSALLDKIGIKHDVKYAYKPMYDKNYFVDWSEKWDEL